MNDLISRAKQGDRMAVTELYNSTYKELYFYCRQLCQNDADAQDLVQDTYLIAFDKLAQYRYDNNFRNWLHTIALHKYYNKLRKEKPQLWADEPVGIPFEDELSCPEEYAENRELYRFITRIVENDLTEPQRLTVIMFYYDEMSIPKIAETLECSEGTVKSRLFYSRKLIREELENGGYALGGGMLMISASFTFNAADFVAGASVNSGTLAAVLKSKSVTKGAAVKSVKTFAKRKLIVGAATIAIAGGAAAVRHALNEPKTVPDEPSHSAAVEIPTRHAVQFPTSSIKAPTEVATEAAVEPMTGVSIPGNEPREYDFASSLFKLCIPENYDLEIAYAYKQNYELSESDRKRSDEAKSSGKIMGSTSRIPVRFRPDKFSGDVIMISEGVKRGQFDDLNEVLSKYFGNVELGESSKIVFPADTTNEPASPSEVSGEKIAFTAVSRGHEAVGTAIRCEHDGDPYLFVFADCSGIRQAEYEAAISSIVFRYIDSSWKNDYQHFQQ